MMREGEERKSLVRRDPSKERPAVLERTTAFTMPDGRMLYYAGGAGGVIVVLPPGRLAEWYQWVNDWGEKLIDFVEKLEGGPYGPQEQKDLADHTILETPARVVQVLNLVRKAGRVVVLAMYAIVYLIYLRIKHLLGSH